MNILNKLKLIFPLLLISFLFSCNDSESSGINKEAPTITIRLVDNPGDYKAVNVEIVDVMIRMENETEGDGESEDESSWMSLDANNETVNLLKFTGGFSKVLVEEYPIPTGTLSQIRLVLGDGNTIVIEGEEGQDDEEYALKTPSGQQSGLKVKIDTPIVQGFTYDFILDFDVEKSIVHAGNSGNIILKPVIYASAEATSGIIEGTVSPSDVPAMAKVVVTDPDGDYEVSAYTDENGAFALWGVPESENGYEVVVTPLIPVGKDESDYNSGSTTDVMVTNGQITTIEEPIILEPKPGSITGKVLNEGVVVTVSVEIGGETLSDDIDEDGVFLIENVPPGTYKVILTPASGSGLAVLELNDKVVLLNAITDLGDIELQIL
ncbi:DUF4382 domain-containing protein [Seonamhaeicola maritimus]|uniref:DUF4382 domain-containing protein n=1 Tax=Seonamhaeicola maritimus TaxID=2591822 RepID=UPI002493DF37|nr:DUF4382 domain-containing protein [Seonamhaeicola maritimus]